MPVGSGKHRFCVKVLFLKWFAVWTGFYDLSSLVIGFVNISNILKVLQTFQRNIYW